MSHIQNSRFSVSNWGRRDTSEHDRLSRQLNQWGPNQLFAQRDIHSVPERLGGPETPDFQGVDLWDRTQSIREFMGRKLTNGIRPSPKKKRKRKRRQLKEIPNNWKEIKEFFGFIRLTVDRLNPNSKRNINREFLFKILENNHRKKNTDNAEYLFLLIPHSISDVIDTMSSGRKIYT